MTADTRAQKMQARLEVARVRLEAAKISVESSRVLRSVVEERLALARRRLDDLKSRRETILASQQPPDRL